MLRVSKCCFCFNLKYGFFTFAVISLLYRVCVPTTSYFLMILSPGFYGTSIYLMGVGSIIGWNAVAVVMLCVAMKGIIQSRSILLYPYIVILILETVATIGMFFYILCTMIAFWALVFLFITSCVNIYAAISLVSLFYTFEDYEKQRPPPMVYPEIIRVM